MGRYLALARRYRPQSFSQVLGQDPVVHTLKQALLKKRVSHAYLFSGERGTGKTTLARLLAKALNCTDLSLQGEPCNQCSSCHEISEGHALHVLEVDGASHRGIDDMRELNETVGYAAPSGHKKVYIVDEVHMLTKEAFNALLKTLEEPPPHVTFIFATTEMHRIPTTILSRCQRFQLRPLSPSLIAQKLAQEAAELQAEVTEAALLRIGTLAEGGVRDAESLFDQLLASSEGPIDEEKVNGFFGLLPRDLFIELDQAVKKGNLVFPLQLAEKIIHSGIHLGHFLNDFISHLRLHLRLLVDPLLLPQEIGEAERPHFQEMAEVYNPRQLLELLDELIPLTEQLLHSATPRLLLELILTRVVRSAQQLPLEEIIQRLEGMEKRLQGGEERRAPAEKRATPPEQTAPQKMPPAPPPKQSESSLPRSRVDTLLQFAAVEFEGRIQRNG